MGTPIQEYRPPESRYGTAAKKLSLVRHEQFRNGVQLKNFRKIKEVSADIARLDERARKTSRRDPESRADLRITMRKLRQAQRHLEELVAQREKHYEMTLVQREQAQAKKAEKKKQAWLRKQTDEAWEQLKAGIYEECEAAVIAEELREAKRGL